MRLGEALVDHVEDRRHLRHSRQGGRSREQVVQEIDAGTGDGAAQDRLLGEHAPDTPARLNRDADDLDVLRPWLGCERSHSLIRREHDDAVEPPLQRGERPDQSARIQLRPPGLAWNEMEGVQANGDRHAGPCASPSSGASAVRMRGSRTFGRNSASRRSAAS